jgi:signal transduction histidine kinase
MRTLIFDLRGEAIDEGLVAALAKHGARLRDSSGLTIDVQGPARLALAPDVETHLYGIGCEAMANAVKHAAARTVWIRVEAPADRVFLEVSDDGRGFDRTAPHPGHFGLDSMRSRATEIGGHLTIESAAGKGTVVRVEVLAKAGESQ